MSTQIPSVPEPVQKWAEHWVSSHSADNPAVATTLLAGDGSARQFYRLSWDGSQTAILVHDPGWKYSQHYSAHQKFLKSQGIQVPDFLHQDTEQGIFVLGDLGDVLLQQHLKNHPDQKIGGLEKAIEFLAEWHLKTHPIPSEVPGSQIAFTPEKFTQELGYTLEHLNTLLNRPTQKPSADIEKFCTFIANYSPRVFCHRDFHTRNLMWFKDSLYAIDFQDARMGPAHYDIASVLYDAYLPLEQKDRTHLLGHYKTAVSSSDIFAGVDWNHFEKELEAIAFQRVIKAMGSFAAFFNKQGKKTHLGYLKPAIQMARQLENTHSECKGLFPLADWEATIAGNPWEK